MPVLQRLAAGCVVLFLFHHSSIIVASQHVPSGHILRPHALRSHALRSHALRSHGLRAHNQSATYKVQQNLDSDSASWFARPDTLSLGRLDCEASKETTAGQSTGMGAAHICPSYIDWCSHQLGDPKSLLEILHSRQEA